MIIINPYTKQTNEHWLFGDINVIIKVLLLFIYLFPKMGRDAATWVYECRSINANWMTVIVYVWISFTL